ncbi:outer membrane lipoprotein chaperone LolA [Pseudidiomarina sp.]|uniref:outer membrane lipoprotein chaperone LolA n=1 Tax=Pseudidiomarina sp. TaxID=2081707 RepID=UPI00299E1934|nr:outer membrane lipoprotein chaperone LolA [Pseudidiomarina sp.]MDX1705451.1 outer membrane lipoprotein chaperone LolA [Pseudidiomarina sp.]
MMKKAVISGFTLALTLMVSSLSQAHAATADKDALIERLAGLATLQAEFSQQVTDPAGELVQQLHGRLALARPSYLYWQTDAPDETLMVADGGNLWYYNPFVEQVTVYEQAEAMEQSPLLLLLDANAQAWSHYTVKQEGNSFALQPSPSADTQQSLQLIFAEDQNNAALQRIILDDGQGQISTIELENPRLNQPVERDLFEFTLPEGVDLDDQRN